ncbi:hypothetical protein B0H10DRAFT_1956565 [Mycena sp. CBHHK59/15]|nr:hypothetical protein B0H10DRAFT_1956565 [Mycena sp. CBHHK59/15]
MSSPQTPPRFPICARLGYNSPHKTKIRPLVKQRLSALLEASECISYPPEEKIHPHEFGDHRLTRPRINPGHANPHHLGQPFQWCSAKLHPNCNQRYHSIKLDRPESAQELVRRVPELGLLLQALREVAPTPRDRHSRPGASRGVTSPSASTSRLTGQHLIRQPPLPALTFNLALSPPPQLNFSLCFLFSDSHHSHGIFDNRNDADSSIPHRPEMHLIRK